MKNCELFGLPTVVLYLTVLRWPSLPLPQHVPDEISFYCQVLKTPPSSHLQPFPILSCSSVNVVFSTLNRPALAILPQAQLDTICLVRSCVSPGYHITKPFCFSSSTQNVSRLIPGLKTWISLGTVREGVIAQQRRRGSGLSLLFPHLSDDVQVVYEHGFEGLMEQHYTSVQKELANLFVWHKCFVWVHSQRAR